MRYFILLYNLILFNSIACRFQNEKMYDGAVFADRFPYQLAMVGDRELIGLSRLLHAHIAYEIDTSKINSLCLIIPY